MAAVGPQFTLTELHHCFSTEHFSVTFTELLSFLSDVPLCQKLRCLSFTDHQSMSSSDSGQRYGFICACRVKRVTHRCV